MPYTNAYNPLYTEIKYCSACVVNKVGNEIESVMPVGFLNNTITY